MNRRTFYKKLAAFPQKWKVGKHGEIRCNYKGKSTCPVAAAEGFAGSGVYEESQEFTTDELSSLVVAADYSRVKILDEYGPGKTRAGLLRLRAKMLSITNTKERRESLRR